MITLETSICRFIGASTDTKPVGADVPAGSSFLENDTGKIFRWDRFEWKHNEAISDELQCLQLILIELTQLRELVTLATQ